MVSSVDGLAGCLPADHGQVGDATGTWSQDDLLLQCVSPLLAQSGHDPDVLRCPFMTQSGHKWQRALDDGDVLGHDWRHNFRLSCDIVRHQDVGATARPRR